MAVIAIVSEVVALEVRGRVVQVEVLAINHQDVAIVVCRELLAMTEEIGNPLILSQTR
jgi:hypothetical protein